MQEIPDNLVEDYVDRTFSSSYNTSEPQVEEYDVIVYEPEHESVVPVSVPAAEEPAARQSCSV